ncbi:MAG: hypothetical protein QM813_24785 [Verrucomicrobiota bacterium]
MARRPETTCISSHQPQSPEEIRLCNHVRAVFGWTADAIRCLALSDSNGGLYAVRIRSGCEDSLEFICTEDMLICIPPKRGG